MNSGAAGFQIFPAYNDDAHCLDKCIFMNNCERHSSCLCLHCLLFARSLSWLRVSF